MSHTQFKRINIGDRVREGAVGITRTVEYVANVQGHLVVITNKQRGYNRIITDIGEVSRRDMYLHWQIVKKAA